MFIFSRWRMFERCFSELLDKIEYQSAKMNEFCYGIVGNIPSELRSADLRAFFSQFIESKGFLCFHFRHRPELQRNSKINSSHIHENGEKTCCCVIKVYKSKMDELIQSYNNQNWTTSTGRLLKNKVLISRIKVCKENEDQLREGMYQTKQEKQQSKRTTEEFFESDLKNLLEMNPPQIMPNGNVGTPLCVFIELIRACKFPPYLIKKLGLSFPRSKNRKYGNVPFDYEILDPHERLIEVDEENNDQSSEEITSTENSIHVRSEGTTPDESQSSDSKSLNTRENSVAVSDFIIYRNRIASKSENQTANSQTSSMSLLGKNKGKKPSSTSTIEHEKNSDEELEEWDRHAALHNDITSQERTKERLYEEDIELKWEKGGSGLVWYTDAAFWKQQEEADFDEETADDWDVDMSIYEEQGGGDLDAKTLLQLRVEKEWEHGKSIDLNRVGGFEKYTRGFGGNIMKKQGWKEGQSLGSSQLGITEPLPNDGQHPSSKRGLGFYGEKLNRNIKRPRPTRELVISTVYDKEDERQSELFQSDGPYSMKYRDKVDFVPEKGNL